jgi:hypothetical protein
MSRTSFVARAQAPLPGGQRRLGGEQVEVVWMDFGEAVQAALTGGVAESVSVARDPHTDAPAL